MAIGWCPFRNRPSRNRVVICTLVSVPILFYVNCLTMFQRKENAVFHLFKTSAKDNQLNIRYNLLEETSLRLQNNLFNESQCSLGYINKYRLQQNHPCVIELIRRHHLKKPSSPDTPYKLEHPEVTDQSAVQTGVVLEHLRNKTNGFFIECGAFDGEVGSNTLYMERFLGWKGILIEADPESFRKLVKRNRKSWALPVCLSPKPYPVKVAFHINSVAGKIFNRKNEEQQAKKKVWFKEGRLAKVQCFPLYSILLAVGQTQIDYFSVDVEGSETDVLTNVPWHKVDVKALTVEVTSRDTKTRNTLARYMEEQRFINAGLLDGTSYYDLVFVQRIDILNNTHFV